ncbi:MAG TPA: hypothetical protein VN969_13490 [Streptosporangiaceae bacterium]|nr:hypothetical protein [Streptosporangiaceae bacterium]
MPGQYPFSAYATPTAARAATPAAAATVTSAATATRKAPGFSQGYCSVAPGTVSGHLKKGASYWPCRVEISDAGVTLATQVRNQTIDTAPAGSVSLSWVRRTGTGTVIMMDGRLWVIDFTRACQHEQTLRGLPGLFQGVRRARMLNRAFTSALQEAACS